MGISEHHRALTAKSYHGGRLPELTCPELQRGEDVAGGAVENESTEGAADGESDAAHDLVLTCWRVLVTRVHLLPVSMTVIQLIDPGMRGAWRAPSWIKLARSQAEECGAGTQKD